MTSSSSVRAWLGLTAAIYTARANLAPVILEGEPSSTSDQPGGQLMLTTEVENFPGFEHGIMGPESCHTCAGSSIGAELITTKATKVEFSQRPFAIWTGNPDAEKPTYLAKTVIISTGARSLMLDLPAEQRLLGHGVSTCATVDWLLLPWPPHCRRRWRRLCGREKRPSFRSSQRP